MIRSLILFFSVVYVPITLLLSANNAFADEKKALRYLDRREFDKVVETLDKNIEKDSLNPGSYYVYALLFNDLLYEKNNLDTAYYYVLDAERLIQNLDIKELQKLNKSGISEKDIGALKKQLEKRAYQRALSINSIESINDFLDRFPTSELIEEANSALYGVAYAETRDVNTFQAYYKFMNTYPDAEQFDEANELYEKLLYEDQTKDNSLESFEDFIIKFPQSPYINDAIKFIYLVRTCGNTEKSLLDFIRDYPNSNHIKESINRLYFNNLSSGKGDFSYNYNFLDLSDSIKNVDKYSKSLLIPVFEDGKYGFMTEKGYSIIENQFDGIDLDYLCGNIKENILTVVTNGKTNLYSRTGVPVYTDDFYNAEDLGYGLLKVSYNGKYGLITSFGNAIFDFEYEDISLINSQLLKASINEGWKLFSLTGFPLSDDTFEEIEEDGSFLFFKKDGKWAITNNEEIFEEFFNHGISLKFIYDDYELVEETQVLCFKGEEESIIGKDLKPYLPFENQNIYPLPEGWLIKRDSLYHIYDDAFVKISGSGLYEIEYKGNWIAGKLKDKWILYNNYTPFPDTFTYDSINILSDQFVLVFENEVPALVFNNMQKIPLSEYESIHILQSSTRNSEPENTAGFLLLKIDEKENIVYNNHAKVVLKGNYDKIQALGPNYLKYRSKDKTGLKDSSGKVLIKPAYDGIANYSEGAVSLLKDQKFGLYNRKAKIRLEPDFSRILKTYNRKYLIASGDEGYGLINHKGDEIAPFISEEIIYWNDTTMLAKEDGYWHLIDIISGEYLIADIYDFSFFKDADEKVLRYSIDGLFGVISSSQGALINCSFNDIINLGNENTPVYFTETFIPEAGFYIVIYYDGTGKILRKQVFDELEYDKIYCN